MRTPKRLYAQPRLMYQPELLTCPHCDDRLALCNYLAWDKIVKHVDVRMEYFRALPTSTTVEVRRLAHPDFLVEVEAIAVVD